MVAICGQAVSVPVSGIDDLHDIGTLDVIDIVSMDRGILCITSTPTRPCRQREARTAPPLSEPARRPYFDHQGGVWTSGLALRPVKRRMKGSLAHMIRAGNREGWLV